LGGAKIILSTVTSGKAVTAVLGGLGIGGNSSSSATRIQPLEVPGRLLIAARRSITGWPPAANRFARHPRLQRADKARPMTEVFPLGAPGGLRTHDERQSAVRVVVTTGL